MYKIFRRSFFRSSLRSLVGVLGLPALSFGSSQKAPADNDRWKCVLTLDKDRNRIDGGTQALVSAIRKGADLRVYTEFRHNEHIDTSSNNAELIKEVADFRVTYLLEDRWVAGIINLRQPIELPDGFGPRPSMSFFLYNQNGDQAIARPYLDGKSMNANLGSFQKNDHSKMPKYHQFDAWDSDTNAPSSNFVYDFETYKFWVCDDWEEVYANNVEGETLSGSIHALSKAFAAGREVKVAIAGLCRDVDEKLPSSLPHEVFVHCGSCYYYTERKHFIAASHPTVRVKPAIPLKYKSQDWDFGWLMLRSDGHVARWLVDPYTLKFSRSHGRYSIRWFVR